MKIAFATCVRLGLSCIEEIYRINGKLDLLISLKDESQDKSGRIYLDDIAYEHNIPLLKVNNINDPEVIKALKDYEIDWLLSSVGPKLLKKKFLKRQKGLYRYASHSASGW